MKAVIVTGGRDYTDEDAVNANLFRLRPDLVIQGGATGAGTRALQWTESYANLCWTVPALWDEQGKSAGHRRNAVMCDIGKALVKGGWTVTVLAFPGGKGTKGMIDRATHDGLKVEHAIVLTKGVS